MKVKQATVYKIVAWIQSLICLGYLNTPNWKLKTSQWPDYYRNFWSYDSGLQYKTLCCVPYDAAKANLARIVNYDCKVRFKLKCTFTIVHYDCETFIKQATGYKIGYKTHQIRIVVRLLKSEADSLNCSFRCDIILNIYYYDYSHTLLCCLSPTLMFNKPTSEAGSLNKSSCLAPTWGAAKFIIVTDLILVTLCCATLVGLRC
jgi:hypothetical protein